LPALTRQRDDAVNRRPKDRTPKQAAPTTLEAMRVAAFRATLRTFLHESERAARDNGLTPQRYLLLLMIKGASDGSEQATITTLGERLRLAQSTVTELVTRAEKAGLVAREQSEADARVVHLRLTERGERCLADVFTHLDVEREQLRQAFEALDAELESRNFRDGRPE
jgi:DNA-binding MarR family transcriptional regulator